jgi:hypothetical protein
LIDYNHFEVLQSIINKQVDLGGKRLSKPKFGTKTKASFWKNYFTYTTYRTGQLAIIRNMDII